MKINLLERFGEYCINTSQGKSLYLLFRAAIKINDIIEVDALGIRVMSSDFLEDCLKKLTKEFTKKQIYTHIKFKNINIVHQNSIKFYIDIFYKYHKNETFRYFMDAYYFKKDTVEKENKNAKKTRKTSSKTVPVSTSESVVV